MELERARFCANPKFEHIKDISKYMDSDQLKYRLTHSEREVMDCNYRTNSGCLDYDDNWYSCIELSKNGISIFNILITKDGKLSPLTKNRYGITVDTIEDFYKALSLSNDYDLTAIKYCMDLHKNDLLLRNYIIDAVRNGLLYSLNTIPEHGKIRMDNFTKDMLILYPNIELDARCSKTYINREIEEEVIKKDSSIRKLLRSKK